MRKLAALTIMVIMFLMATVSVFAAPDPNLTIVNPVNDTTITSTNLLVSVKIVKKQTVKVSVYKEVASESGATWQTVFTGDTFTSKNNLSFYTKKVENVSPGKYRVKVETVGSGGTIAYVTTSDVIVKEKADTEDKATFNANTGTATTYIHSILKSIFGS